MDASCLMAGGLLSGSQLLWPCVASLASGPSFRLSFAIASWGVAAPEVDSEGWPRKAGALHLHAIG